ncbi:hypothetical protein [Thalassotalea atypica]|uniref:hypothetical protein n=1 Tax=Thalassotalea atypica TaxID=2054316 RepID=UPI0025728C3D|nr:hypothetical protein [Thalassotalea atypica]
MSPEQLNKLREISELFEQGKASVEQVKQLNDILSRINRHQHGSDIRDKAKVD